jgi:hypothetical protein
MSISESPSLQTLETSRNAESFSEASSAGQSPAEDGSFEVPFGGNFPAEDSTAGGVGKVSSPRLFLPLEKIEVFESALRALEWRGKIHSPPKNDERQEERHQYDGPMILVLDLPAQVSSLGRIACPACCRNISRSGVGALVANYLVPADSGLPDSGLASGQLLVCLDRWLEPGMSCLTCFPAIGKDPLWLAGKIVRKRLVGRNLLELGIKLTTRL